MPRYRNILITGGAGFVGSNLALWLKAHDPDTRVTAADSLRRRGSETTLPRLRTHGIEFVHCDIRSPEDLRLVGDGRKIDLLIECSAEPSVLAGYGEAPDYVINTNLIGTIHCLALARHCGADLIFLSTSRVYPVSAVNRIATEEAETRFVLAPEQALTGVSPHGISEASPHTVLARRFPWKGRARCTAPPSCAPSCSSRSTGRCTACGSSSTAVG